MAWLNKGLTPEYMAQARGFFERALALDPENIEALVGMARVDAATGSCLYDRRPGRASRGGRGDLDQGSVPRPEPCSGPRVSGHRPNVYEPRGPRHR